MPGRTTSFLRLLAATLVIGSGTGRVASLWFRELNHQAVLDATIGAIYLFMAIGLYGSSRFTLFVAMGLPLASALYTATHYGAGLWPALRMLGDTLIILGAALSLLRPTRPSVA